MHSKGACTVVAAAFPAEDDALRAMLETLGFSEILCVYDGIEALELVRRRQPDLLLTDAILPGQEGAALAALAEDLPLAVHPAVIVAALPGMSLCALPCGCERLEKPFDGDALAHALWKIAPERRRIPDRKRRLAAQTLDALGIPAHPGCEYLQRAVEIAWADARLLRALSGRIYPAIADEFSVPPRHVERAIRHVIDAAWRSGEIDAQYKIFGNTIDAKRGNPTCGEMIAQIADILRWEGRA